MRVSDSPRGIAFDYGHTLVRLRRPVAALERAGADLAGLLRPGGWSGDAAALGPALDTEVDRLADQAHLEEPEVEVDASAIYRQALRALLGAEPSDELVRRALLGTQRAWVEGVLPDPTALPVLAQLQHRGLRLGLCSNALYPPDLMREQLARLGLAGYFHATLFTSEIGWRKPAARVFQELLARLELPADQVWFVGDDWEADIVGSRRSGMRALVAPGGCSRDPAVPVLGGWPDLLQMIG
ncbi:MAG: HAD family hydrolase [Candidatus Dormibacteria bacterium]